MECFLWKHPRHGVIGKLCCILKSLGASAQPPPAVAAIHVVFWYD
jgi:hypothetical protein